MRFLPSDKYSVAWFKLAECVSRGERERALGVYRLLAHSLDDAAFARQLEGDIYLAFDDISLAIDRYKDAMTLYQQAGRSLEAAAVGEHILTLDPQKQEYIGLLASLYHETQVIPKACHYYHMLCALGLANHDLDGALTALDRLDTLSSAQATLAIRQEVLAMLIKRYPVPTHVAERQLHKTVQSLVESNDHNALQQFLMTLEQQNQHYFALANKFVEQS